MRVVTSIAVAVALAVGAGCGDETESGPAREGKAVELAGVDYIVYLTRQLNPFIPPADEWYDGPRVGRGQALFGVFIEACNISSEPRRSSEELRIEDSFGNIYRPVELDRDNPFDYDPRLLAPDECVPRAGSAGDLPGGGALVAFRVPERATSNRPWELVIEAPGDGAQDVRIELDL